MAAFLPHLPLPPTTTTLLPRHHPRCRRRPPRTPLHASATPAPTQESVPVHNISEEVSRRRNFAIISHPDAGKSTLTEKLLLYGGAIQQAGSVRSRRQQRHVTSDSMAIEQERGISITSSVLTFDYLEKRINITDCPGHADFGEDTYRTLAAVDNALMLIDAGKGLEEQTRKLFGICAMRELPIFTFVNKMDRPALSAFEIGDQIENEFGIRVYPMAWPIGDGDRFRGVYERASRNVHLFERGDRGQKAEQNVISVDDERLRAELGDELYEQLLEDIDILEEVGDEWDEDAVKSGSLSPMFFGSAMSNFGVELFLRTFLKVARCPPEKDSSVGMIKPDESLFTGQVFKLQANMDARHRDRLAFVRVFSGIFEKGMKVTNARHGKTVALTRPQGLFAGDRHTVDYAFAGDVIGLNNPGAFKIGDTIYGGKARGVVKYEGIPSFSPELFCYIKNPNPSSYKNFRKGLSQLLEEGAVQMLRRREDEGNENPILAAVGQLQFEVVVRRLKDEYGVEALLEPIGYSVCRWVVGKGDPWKALDSVGRLFGVLYCKDGFGRPVLLFKNSWSVDNVLADHSEALELAPWAFAPEEE